MNVAFHFDDRRSVRRKTGEISSLSSVLAAIRPFLHRGSPVQVRVGHLMLTSLAMRKAPCRELHATVRQFDPERFESARQLWLATLEAGWFAKDTVPVPQIPTDDIFVVACFGLTSDLAHSAMDFVRGARRFLFAIEIAEEHLLARYLYRDSLIVVASLESREHAAIFTDDKAGSELLLEDWLRGAGFSKIEYRLHFDMDDDTIEMVLRHLHGEESSN